MSASDAMGLRGATLREALKEDTEAGFHPFVLSSWGVLAIKKDVILIFSTSALQLRQSARRHRELSTTCLRFSASVGP